LYTCIKAGNESIPVSSLPLTFWSNSSDVENISSVQYSICITEMRDSPLYVQGYILLANFLVMAFIPFITLTTINTMLYRSITSSSNTNNKRNNSRHKRDQTIAMILVGIVIVFVFCNAFRIIINLYEVRLKKILK